MKLCECLLRANFLSCLSKSDIIPVGTERDGIVGVLLADLRAQLCQHIVSVPIPRLPDSEGSQIRKKKKHRQSPQQTSEAPAGDSGFF